jgi:hypothetical protein
VEDSRMGASIGPGSELTQTLSICFRQPKGPQAATHNDAPHDHLPGSRGTPIRRSERQLITATSFPGWDGIGGHSICTSLEASNTLWKRGSGEFRGIQGH